MTNVIWKMENGKTSKSLPDCLAIAKTAVGALEKALVRVAASVVSKGVEAAAALSDLSGTYYERREGTAWFSEARNATPWMLDCSQVGKLARRELTRRGLAG